MTPMDEFFQTQQTDDHPKLRSWLKQRDAAGTAHIQFRRKRDGLSFKAASLYVIFSDASGAEVGTDGEPWDDDLNAALVQHRFAAVSPANEAERFGYMLRHLLRPIEVRYGDGFFNAVLLNVVKGSALGIQPAVAAILSEVHSYNASASASSVDCAERIKGVIASCARDLVLLGHPRVEAEVILAAAIAHYLDERFSVTNRKLMGW